MTPPKRKLVPLCSRCRFAVSEYYATLNKPKGANDVKPQEEITHLLNICASGPGRTDGQCRKWFKPNRKYLMAHVRFYTVS